MYVIISHQIKSKDRNRRRKNQISQLATGKVGGKRMSFLEDNDLNIKTRLLINISPQPTNKIPQGKAHIQTSDQLANSTLIQLSIAHLHSFISHSSLICRDASA